MRTLLPPLALLHDGDSFILYLSEVGTRCVRLEQIHRFTNNDSSEGSEENFDDLDHITKLAVLEQIKRKYKERTLMT